MQILDSELLFLSGNDIPFPEGKITLHQPTLKEIAYIGENAFFQGLELLKFSKKSLGTQDKKELQQLSDFYIIMSILMDKKSDIQDLSSNTEMILQLVLSNYEFQLLPQGIACCKPGTKEIVGGVTEDNFSAFKAILFKMFRTKDTSSEVAKYSPKGDMAKRIAEKFKKREQQLAKLNSSNKNGISILAHYASVLAIGEQESIDVYMNYTVYQLFDQFQRFQLKLGWDSFVQARLAGSTKAEQPESWLENLYNGSKKKK